MYEYKAKVTNVVDGDTLDCLIDLGFNISHSIRIRLLGVDTPELSIKSQREQGLKVKGIVESELLNKEVVIRTRKETIDMTNSKDAYGRYLAIIILDGKIYNNSLIDRGLVKSDSKWNEYLKLDGV